MHMQSTRFPHRLTASFLAAAVFTISPACSDYDDAVVVPPDVPATPDVAGDTSILDDAATDTAIGPDVDPLRPAHCSARVSPGPAPLRRLTRSEYENTLAELLGDTSRPGALFPPEEEVLGFDNNAAGRAVSNVHVELYMAIAERLIADAMRNRRSDLIACDIDLMDDAVCARESIERFGRRAFRRPLREREITAYMVEYDTLTKVKPVARAQFDEAMTLIFEVILQSPQFLYRPEFGNLDTAKDGVVHLSGHEIATRLAYLLWVGPPDDELLAAAEIGTLDSAAGIAAQARRILDHPKGRAGILHFHQQWLKLKKLPAAFKDEEAFPQYSPELRAMMKKETEAFIEWVVFDGDSNFVTLLSGPFTFLNKTLADFYGLPSEGMGDQFQQYFMPPTQRAGILTHASMMSLLAKSDQTSPVIRGHFLRENIMCQYIAPPPNDINITPPDLQPGLTTRERFRQHNEDPACAGCHARMDPVGLPFENYDPIGRWRDLEDGLQIDASGELSLTWDRSTHGPVNSAVELIHRMASNGEVRSCYATQWFRYAYGRGTTFTDECHMYDLMKVFEGSDWNIRELLVALTQTEAFRYRNVIVPGSDAPTDPF